SDSSLHHQHQHSFPTRRSSDLHFCRRDKRKEMTIIHALHKRIKRQKFSWFYQCSWTAKQYLFCVYVIITTLYKPIFRKNKMNDFSTNENVADSIRIIRTYYV